MRDLRKGMTRGARTDYTNPVNQLGGKRGPLGDLGPEYGPDQRMKNLGSIQSRAQ